MLLDMIGALLTPHIAVMFASCVYLILCKVFSALGRGAADPFLGLGWE